MQQTVEKHIGHLARFLHGHASLLSNHVILKHFSQMLENSHFYAIVNRSAGNVLFHGTITRKLLFVFDPKNRVSRTKFTLFIEGVKRI